MSNDYLLETILELTGDAKNSACWKKFIRLLPESAILEETGELKYQMSKGSIKNPAKYLVALFKKRLRGEKVIKEAGSPPPKMNNHKCKNQVELFSELVPRKKGDKEGGRKEKMPARYSSKYIPWLSFLGPEFFTLSTNKRKSDRVLARFVTFGGDDRLVPVLRGKYFPGDSERGILTTEHGRILIAIEDIWLEQSMAHGYDFVMYDETGACHCYCVVSVRELAKRLGWKSFNGGAMKHLKRKVMDLKVCGYYLDLKDVEAVGSLGGYGFSLLAEVEIIPEKGKIKGQIFLKVTFSDPVSRQLIKRRAVYRPKEMMRHRSELAFLLRLEIERSLMGCAHYERTLKELILILNLPAGGWHKYASDRHRQFDKAVKELNMCHLVDGRKWQVTLVKTDDDHKLVAQAIGTARLLEEQYK
ncbi:MAG: hypothetical protein CVT48_01175 [Thermoplasmata archaeon HGW-Thermoplasmata-1]|nr:MAG: hypothetical protein CVT48_01175 [Thermoplasmata archaeon HGW-Thermoplasmata-1]